MWTIETSHISLQFMAYRREQTRVYSKLGWMYFVTVDFRCTI